jgi:hypothetical protein
MPWSLLTPFAAIFLRQDQLAKVFSGINKERRPRQADVCFAFGVVSVA